MPGMWVQRGARSGDLGLADAVVTSAVGDRRSAHDLLERVREKSLYLSRAAWYSPNQAPDRLRN